MQLHDCQQNVHIRRPAGVQIVGYSTADEAVERATREADTVDAVVGLEDLEGGPGGVGYTLRVNHTQVPTTRSRLNVLDVQPDVQYKKYWLFSNLQLHLDRCVRFCESYEGWVGGWGEQKGNMLVERHAVFLLVSLKRPHDSLRLHLSKSTVVQARPRLYTLKPKSLGSFQTGSRMSQKA